MRIGALDLAYSEFHNTSRLGERGPSYLIHGNPICWPLIMSMVLYNYVLYLRCTILSKIFFSLLIEENIKYEILTVESVLYVKLFRG